MKSADENVIFFQISRFVSFYEIYRYLFFSVKPYPFRSYSSQENMQALLLTNLCFLFDKNNPQSLINASFKDAELKKLHNELLKEWDRVDEDNLKDIIKNIGFLNTFELKSMKIAHSQIRSLDKESFIITDKLIELHKLLKLHIQNIIISL